MLERLLRSIPGSDMSYVAMPIRQQSPPEPTKGDMVEDLLHKLAYHNPMVRDALVKHRHGIISLDEMLAAIIRQQDEEVGRLRTLLLESVINAPAKSVILVNREC